MRRTNEHAPWTRKEKRELQMALERSRAAALAERERKQLREENWLKQLRKRTSTRAAADTYKKKDTVWVNTMQGLLAGIVHRVIYGSVEICIGKLPPKKFHASVVSRRERMPL